MTRFTAEDLSRMATVLEEGAPALERLEVEVSDVPVGAPELGLLMVELAEVLYEIADDRT